MERQWSQIAPMSGAVTPIDRTIFIAPRMAAGAFRCPVEHPRFIDEGRPHYHLMVFPRSVARIEHASARPFLADPRMIVLYHPRQEYRRSAVSPEGDRSDWFGVDDATARDLMNQYGSGKDDREALFPAPYFRCDAALYLHQRQLHNALAGGAIEPLAAEQAILEVFGEAIRRAHPTLLNRARTSSSRTRAAHQDISEAARVLLAADVTASLRLTDIAGRLGVSPFHLCRVFREQTGTTLNEYRLDLRVRMALESITEPARSLSTLAFDLGFASHSHFTAALRKRMHTVPSAVRRMLLPGDAATAGGLPTRYS